MGLQYKRQEQSETSEFGNQEAPTEFNIVNVRTQMNSELVNSQELDNIVSTISVNEPHTIVEFGSGVAEEISKCSDQVLQSVNMSQLNESSELLKNLGKIMENFDLEEISEEKTGFFGKLFGDMKKQLDKVLDKYHTMGGEIDKIYVQLKKYEDEIKQSNKTLDMMFQSNINYYRELVKYIMAGEQGVKEIDTYLEDMRNELIQSADNSIQFDITSLEQAKIMLEQRTQDLRIAENVAMQSIPMIKTMQFSNLNLIRKINSAFIITLPVFKQALTQAILLKRQKIQADSMAALDQQTNEMLIKNAQNTAAQSRLTMELASGSSVKVETLEQTWKTIVQGIDETRRIQEESRAKREADIATLSRLKEDFKNKMNMQ